MSIALEKLKKASSRFTLVRFEPARYINDDLVSQGGGIYSVQFTDISDISRITRNGTQMTRVSAAPAANDEYSFDESSKTLSIKIASAPNVNSNVIIAFHYLYLTTQKGRYYGKDPLDPVSDSNPSRFWEPKLQSSPSASETFKNVLAGVITIANTTLSIIDTDTSIRDIIGGDNDSISNSNTVVWYGINDSLALLFTGKVGSGFSVSGNGIIRVAVFDTLNKLTALADMGNPELSYARKSNYPRLDMAKQDNPIPWVFGKTSPTVIRSEYIDPTEASVDGKAEVPRLIATNIEYGRTSQDNKTYVLCNQFSNIKTQAFGTLQAYTNLAFNGSIVDAFALRYSSLSEVRVGDALELTYDPGSGSVTNYFRILHVGNFTSGSNTYNIMCPAIGLGSTPGSLGNITATTPNKSISIYGPGWADPSDYSLSVSVFGGVYTVKVTFVGSRSPMADVSFRTSSDGFTHANALKKLCQLSGLETEDATFAAADLELSATVNLTVPQFDESRYSSYLDYCELITKSTLGYIAPNKNGKIEYHLLKAPVPTTSITDLDVIESSLTSSIKYSDIASSLTLTNPNVLDETDITLTSISSESNKSKYLHSITSHRQLRHCLNDISARASAIASVYSQRQMEHDFSTATKNIDTLLGEDFNLNATGSIAADGKVTDIKRNPQVTTIKINNLRGL